MDYPKFIVSNQKEESISIQRVKASTQTNNIQSRYLNDYVVYVDRRPFQCAQFLDRLNRTLVKSA